MAEHVLVGGSASFLVLWAQIEQEAKAAEAAWISALRGQGVKAAHPDDGWVDQAKNRLQFVYPQFNDGAGSGDLVALGGPPDRRGMQHRIVRLTELKQTILSEHWAFEPMEQS